MAASLKSIIRSFDTSANKRVAHIPKSYDTAMHIITWFGGPVATSLVLLGIMLIGLQFDDRRVYVIAIGAFVAIIVNTSLKFLLRRERPETDYAKQLRSYSFPSGHSAGAFSVYGALWLTLAVVGQLHVALLVVFAALLTVLSLLIGVSRVYLGAHFPSDVLVGWVIAIAGLIITWNVI